MPPRKRKAAEEASESENDSALAPTPAKKSKKDLQAELRARAREAIQQSQQKKSKSTPVATETPPRSRPAVASTAVKAKASTTPKRKTKSSRKSTGGISERVEKANKEVANQSVPFTFNPPTFNAPASSRQNEHVSSGPTGTPIQSSDYHAAASAASTPSRTTPYKFGNGSEEKDVPKVETSTKKTSSERARMREEAHARALEFKKKLHGKTSPSAAQMEEDSPEKPSKAARLSSPQLPVSSRSTPASTTVTASIAMASTTVSRTTTAFDPTAAASSKNLRAKTPKKSTQPAAVAAIFSPKKQSTAHRPALNAGKGSGATKFDPNQPWPPAGYKLPTAAYCGCGPTPFSRTTTSVRASELCTPKMQKMMQEVPPVDPPHRSFSIGDDQENPAARPSPPGTNESERASTASLPRREPDGLKSINTSLGNTTTFNNIVRNLVDPPVTTQNATSLKSVASTQAQKTDVLKSFSKATAMLARAKRANDERRESMGIRSSGAKPVVTLQPGVAQVGSMERNSIPLQELQNEKVPRDPPIDTDTTATVANVSDDVKKEDISQDTKENGMSTSAIDEHNNKMKVVGEENVLQSKLVSFVRKFLQYVAFLLVGCGIAFLISLAYNDEPITMSLGDSKNIHFFPGPLSASIQSEEQAESGTNAKTDLDISCFIDHPSDFYSSGEDLQEDEACAGKYKQCPFRGRCHGGRLRDCNDFGNERNGISLFVPNDKGDKCVPSSEATELVRSVKGALLSLTASHVCRSWGMKGDEYPTFGVWAVADEVSEQSENQDTITPVSLVWLSPVFDSAIIRFVTVPGVNEESIGVMGLGSDVSPNDLPLPFSCTMKLMSWEFVCLLTKFMVKALVTFVNFAWNIFMCYPVFSLCGSIFFYVVQYIRKRYQRKRKVLELFATVVDSVYDRLAECDDNEGYAVLMLRDDVGHDMYPRNVRERLFVFNEVWPLVVAHVNADNRVKKSHKMAHGKDLQHWEFANMSKKVRKSRRSLGSSGDLKNDHLKDEVSTQRDP